MAKAYLAVVDRLGLRALVPEEKPSAQVAVAASRRLHGALCWAICSDHTADQLSSLLDDAEFSAAMRCLSAEAEHFGPIVLIRGTMLTSLMNRP